MKYLRLNNYIYQLNKYRLLTIIKKIIEKKILIFIRKLK